MDQLKAIEPVLRLIEVFVVVVGGIVITTVLSCRQLDVAGQQTVVAEKELQVAEEELKLARLQTDVARVSISPKFVFGFGKDSPLHSKVENVGEATFEQEAEVVHFCRFVAGDGKTKSVKLKGVLPEKELTWRSGSMYFYIDEDLSLGLMASQFRSSFLRRIDECIYFRITYTNRAGEKRTEQYMTDITGLWVKLVNEPPKMDAEFDMLPFCKPEEVKNETKDERDDRWERMAVAIEEAFKRL